MPMQMQDSDYNGFLLQNSEKNTVWKLWNQCTSNVVRNLGKLKRLVLNPLEQRTKFLQEEAPKPSTFRLVPGCRLSHVRHRAWQDS